MQVNVYLPIAAHGWWKAETPMIPPPPTFPHLPYDLGQRSGKNAVECANVPSLALLQGCKDQCRSGSNEEAESCSCIQGTAPLPTAVICLLTLMFTSHQQRS